MCGIIGALYLRSLRKTPTIVASLRRRFDCTFFFYAEAVLLEG